ncbi:tetratricopeptide repeat protein [Ulvibacter sp. MAR_2010_11]|uniref:tetratricopeptide repeat protein n=1 Tax=Ulvibacter sp. MAR_2010_11 TaxID=1250229 RepID=UPI000C2BE299|nr:tetratricopeptide repeat protein [Ulvibacter sp. MAR_2010_11]PKA84252.1 tetratricopeptide repeat protein [Ulvibacter sp. MAR_2010_11]
MKKVFLVTGLILLTAVSFGQKKEIKKAEKAVKSGDYTEAMTLLSQAEPMLGSAETDEKVSFYVTRAEARMNNLSSDFAALSKAGSDLQKALEIDPGASKDSRYSDAVTILKSKMEQMAIKDFRSKDYKSAAGKYFAIYSASKQDTIFLANAAISAKNAQDYETAITYYETLLDVGYTDIKEQYVATSMETGMEEVFDTKTQRDLMVKGGSHIKPVTRNSPSKQEDFLNDLTVMYAETGNSEKALTLLKKLRSTNPNDAGLIRAEADLQYKMGNSAKYQELISELISKDPNNPELYFNLGVTSNKSGNTEKAMEYYKKALELDPNYVGANINMASMILDMQPPLVTEMNGLGTSNADYKRYDILKAKLTEIQRSSIPYLEAAVRLRPEDIDFARTLMNIYTQVGEDAKATAMKAKVEALEGGE